MKDKDHTDLEAMAQECIELGCCDDLPTGELLELINRLKAAEVRLAEARTNEARLEAMLQNSIAREWPNPTALRDLLGPVEALLSRLIEKHNASMRSAREENCTDGFVLFAGDYIEATEQLTRLRAVMGKEKE